LKGEFSGPQEEHEQQARDYHPSDEEKRVGRCQRKSLGFDLLAQNSNGADLSGRLKQLSFLCSLISES
jgi:hypothetical protein